MEKCKVFAIFDDGSSLVKRTHFLLPQDGTIGDAENCFQKYHAQTLWEATDGIELVGILAEKDLQLPCSEVTPSLTHPDFKLQDMVEPTDVLVFRSATSIGGSAKGSQLVSSTAARPETKAESNTTGGDETKDVEAKPVSIKSQKSEEVRCQIRLAHELRRLAGHNKPPRSRRHEGPSTRTERACDENVETEVIAGVDKDGEDKARRLERELRRLAGFNNPPRPTKQQSNVRKRQTKQLYDGLSDKSSPEELPRKKTKVQQKVKEKRTSKKQKQARRGHATRIASGSQLEEKVLNGQPKSVKVSAPWFHQAGLLVKQETRCVYFSTKDETPMDIAKKFGVPAGKIVVDNRQQYPTLRETSRLQPMTCIVMPLECSRSSAVGATCTDESTKRLAANHATGTTRTRTINEPLVATEESGKPSSSNDLDGTFARNMGSSVAEVAGGSRKAAPTDDGDEWSRDTIQVDGGGEASFVIFRKKE